MIHILQKFSLDELHIIQICKNDTQKKIIPELIRMKDFSEQDILHIINGLIEKIKDYPDEEIQKLKRLAL